MCLHEYYSVAGSIDTFVSSHTQTWHGRQKNTTKLFQNFNDYFLFVANARIIFIDIDLFL